MGRCDRPGSLPPSAAAATAIDKPAAAWRGRIGALRVERVALAETRAGESPLALDSIAVRQAAIDTGKRTIAIDEIAVAFACRPRVLLLDEPAAGVPEAERHELLET